MKNVVTGGLSLTVLAGSVLGVPLHLGVNAPNYESIEDACRLSDGGMAYVGSVNDPQSFITDLVVTRHAPDGSLLWMARIGSGSDFEFGYSIIEKSGGRLLVSGNMLLGGTTLGAVTPGGLFVLELSPAGALNWANVYPAAGGGFSSSSLCLYGDGYGSANAAVTSSTSFSDLSGNYQAGSVVTLDDAGNSVTQHAILSSFSTGNSYFFEDVVQPFMGDPLAIVGHVTNATFLSALGPGNSYDDALFLRFTPPFSSVSDAKRYNQTDEFEASQWEYAYAIAANASDTVTPFAMCSTSSHQTGQAGPTLVFRMDASGTIVWARELAEIYPDSGSARIDPQNNVVWAGNFFFGDGDNLGRLASYDPAGNLRFFRQYEGASFTRFTGLEIEPSGGTLAQPFEYLTGGYFRPDFSTRFYDVYPVRTLADGTTPCLDVDVPPAQIVPTISTASLAPRVEVIQGQFPWFPQITLTTPGAETVCTPTCPPDVDDGSGTGTPDGGLTIDDLIYYLTIFENGDLAADFDDGSGTGTPDGGVTIDDLLYYLTIFEAGC
jgi:hypothetical protein